MVDKRTYDSPQFSLPVRLGLLNSKGEQDLLIHILAAERYEVANAPNVTIPTNLVVSETVGEAFGDYYNELFRHTLRLTPGAIVTEYSWDSATCDPCPGPVLSPSDLATLGVGPSRRSLTLTRLHARYSPDDLTADLIFKTAPRIWGGRGSPGADGKLQKGTEEQTTNQFQGRYAVMHPWTDEVTCDEPSPTHWNSYPRSE